MTNETYMETFPPQIIQVGMPEAYLHKILNANVKRSTSVGQNTDSACHAAYTSYEGKLYIVCRGKE